ncbi:SAP domain [Dillenia turbinata]|uniref:Poly [ADP-ribose] polymerase n=1 Tax=Dillenia turbinata TaxID=194707 RepID=A0AAN8W3E1_9MAGN
MASKLKVDELKNELSKRGRSTSGTKPTLVRRLESAIREENKQQVDGIRDSESDDRKRKRDYENGDSNSNGPVKISAIDKFKEMGIRELRQQATLRGISSNGSKKELLERLCNSDDSEMKKNIDEDIPEDEDEREVAVEDKKEAKIVTATKKGGAVLDQWIPDEIKTQYHVLQLGDEIYDAMLNQTNVGENNNKFYVIQVLESDDGGRFLVYARWGRVGVKGQDKMHGPYTSRDDAIREFEQKFSAKTKNNWSNRKEFVCYPKCYTWLEMDYSEREKESSIQEKSRPTTIQPRETKLEQRVAKFISLICNVSMMKQQMLEIGYNAEKLPLGKLSKSTILKGYNVLKRIADVIGQSDRKQLEQLSGEFYTVIPHDFGFKKMREFLSSLSQSQFHVHKETQFFNYTNIYLCTDICEFVIDTPQKLKSKLEMVEALGEIEVATKLLEDDVASQEDPLFSQYQRLRCGMLPVEAGTKEFSMIARYMKNTHAKTHSNYTVDIVQIFRASRESEIERFKKFSCMKNRMLLWHGSRLTNWTGILSQGLRIAPPEAPVTGYMFGKGVYFADMFSKSANYCYSTRSATSGVLLLCEVALGDMAELLAANYHADQLPEGKLSTKGVGATAPDLSEAEILEDGVVVPLGRPKEQQGTKGSLLYNEYIVYNVDQIRMRYVIQVNFKYKK